MAQIARFDPPTLQAICDILGDTTNGLSGSEITRLLKQCGINDPYSSNTKRYRLFEALHQKQLADGCANIILSFVMKAMSPVSYTGQKDCFESRRSDLNVVFAFVGLFIGEDGKFRNASIATTLSEAEKRAHHLRKQLVDRKVHADVLKFCRAELLQENYFHAVFEAAKSVADKIRQKSGLTSDGAALVDGAFSLSAHAYPKLALNSLRTETEKSEQKGFMNLIKGLFGAFRNTTGHAPKITWPINEEDALDILTLASLLHKKLDNAVTTGHNGPVSSL